MSSEDINHIDNYYCVVKYILIVIFRITLKLNVFLFSCDTVLETSSTPDISSNDVMRTTVKQRESIDSITVLSSIFATSILYYFLTSTEVVRGKTNKCTLITQIKGSVEYTKH